MANIQSKIKRDRTNKISEARNKAIKSEIKTSFKKAMASKDAKDINAAVKLVDMAVTKGVFHANKAARINSKLHSAK